MTVQTATGKGFRGMTAESIIADMVREWTVRVLPGDRGAADAAVNFALESYAAGASVSEACDTARRMVVCRSHHPSAQPTRHLAVAS